MSSGMNSDLWSGEKLILGPMVRANSLAFRLTALTNGADMVFSEEIPAWRAKKCVRVTNNVLGTIDFVIAQPGKETDVLFRTSQVAEKDKNCCVLQIGASSSIEALKAASMFDNDVAAIDINMGCPKHYSVSRGGGAALMLKPEEAEDIIKTLRRNLNIPIRCVQRMNVI